MEENYSAKHTVLKDNTAYEFIKLDDKILVTEVIVRKGVFNSLEDVHAAFENILEPNEINLALAGKIIPGLEFEPDLTEETCSPELWAQLNRDTEDEEIIA